MTTGETPTRARISTASRYLLAQLAEPDALIAFTTSPIEGDDRFYFQKGLAHFLVGERAVEALVSRGYIIRTGSPVPIYRITEKGRGHLRLWEVSRAG